MILTINGSTRKGSQTEDICDIILGYLGSRTEYLDLYDFNTIPDNYLEGNPLIDELNLGQYSIFIMVVPSYYVLPSPVFLNFFNQFTAEQIQTTFANKKILLVSVQDGMNLNELHIDSLRRYFNKMFHFHKVDTRVCIDFCMVRRDKDSRVRLLDFIGEQLEKEPCP